jgi:hypothetical protein
MPIDRERQQRVREAVEYLRQHEDDRIDGEDIFREARTISEVLGLNTAMCRARGGDEAFEVEVLLRASGLPRETLLEIERVMTPLGYRDIAAVVRRLIRTAKPRPPTVHERMRA